MDSVATARSNSENSLLGEPPSTETIGQRLRLTARIFRFFVQLRTKRQLDIAAFEIMAAFHLASLAEQEREHGSAAAFNGASSGAVLTATALSEMTGIPRQTVRRRLVMLEAAGYLSMVEGGAYLMVTRSEQFDIVDQVLGMFQR